MDSEQRSKLVTQQWRKIDKERRSERLHNAAVSNRARATLARVDRAVEFLESLGFTVAAPVGLEDKVHAIARQQQRMAVENRAS